MSVRCPSAGPGEGDGYRGHRAHEEEPERLSRLSQSALLCQNTDTGVLGLCPCCLSPPSANFPGFLFASTLPSLIRQEVHFSPCRGPEETLGAPALVCIQTGCRSGGALSVQREHGPDDGSSQTYMKSDYYI